MKTKTKIEKQLTRKTNPVLVETIILAKKNPAWKRIAEVISSPRKQKREKNLDEISKSSKEGEGIIIPGKVLSQGELNKKLKIVALTFSEAAREKILNHKGEAITIFDEIKKNPEAKNLRVLE
ncbi:50S ribosomal protein L18e [Candidatus Pacearchaeota archaeon]|nr:50S ribosomal protein L18e [Candidatus Pacearchaeota archaeon]